MNIDEKAIVGIAQKAGDIIMDIYQSDDFAVETKNDDGFESPLTKADTQANDYIVKELAKASELPIVTEENELSHTIIANEFWLIDPLDGTKDFIKQNGEFTVNIAYVKDGVPLFGVVHAPALDTTYWNEGKKALKQHEGKTREIKADASPEEIIAVSSRSHNTAETTEFLKKHNITKTISVGSSLKFCLIAEGKAHVLPRFTPQMIWDTAAANAVATAAGAPTVEMESGKPLQYRLTQLKTPYYLCSSVSLEVNDEE